MENGRWFGFSFIVAMAFIAATAMVMYAGQQGPELQQCADAPARIIPPPGYVTCTLESGKNIFLRSWK